MKKRIVADCVRLFFVADARIVRNSNNDNNVATGLRFSGSSAR